MAFARNIVYAERRHGDESDYRDIRRSSTLTPATAKPSDEDNAKLDEHKAFLAQTERLLACPCLNELKVGPCGGPFQDAFRCFILSKEAEKGAECAQEFSALEKCMLQHKEMFKKEGVTKAILKVVPKIPAVPGDRLNFNPKVAEWSKES